MKTATLHMSCLLLGFILLLSSCTNHLQEELKHSTDLTITLVNGMSTATNTFKGIMLGTKDKMLMVESLEDLNEYIKNDISPFINSHSREEMFGVKRQFIRCLNAALITIENYNHSLNMNKDNRFQSSGCNIKEIDLQSSKTNLITNTLDREYRSELKKLKILLIQVAEKFQFEEIQKAINDYIVIEQ